MVAVCTAQRRPLSRQFNRPFSSEYPLKNQITRAEMSQAQAAKLFGVTQPRISDLMRGKINLFGLDALVNMATAAGLHIEMRVLEAA